MHDGRYYFRQPRYHFLFWGLVAALWFYLRYQDYDSLQQAAAVTAIKVLDLAGVIYLANMVLVPRFLYTRRWGLFAFLFTGLVALASVAKLAAVAPLVGEGLEQMPVKEAVYNNFVTLFFLTLASIALRSAFDSIRLQKRLADVAREKAETELAFLKAQVNPHFLFNALNAVYFLIDKRNTPARHALHRFSELLRYQLYECDEEKVPIEKEIGFLAGYVDLQKLRLNPGTHVRFACAGDVARLHIEPMLLIPFVENAFKHLSHHDNPQQNEVDIGLRRQNGSLLFSVYNTTEHGTTNGTGGIGLQNVERRLRLLYPNRHRLQVQRGAGDFRVDLELTLNPTT